MILYKEKGVKVKKIVIKPKQSINKQCFDHKSETWCIIEGECQVFINDKIKVSHSGDTFIIKEKDKYKVTNISSEADLNIIRVQMGERSEENARTTE